VPGKTAHTASIALPAPRATAFAGRIPAAVWLTGIVVVSFGVRVLLAAQTPVPWLIPDEIVYSGLARSFSETGHFALRGEPFSPWGFGPLYLVLIAPAFRLGASLPDAYLIVRTLNCVFWSLAALPAYFLARRLLDRRSSLVVAALAVLVPSGVYTVRLGLESIAYPAFLCAALAIISALERPTRKRELVALTAIAVAVLARAQLIVLLPAFALSVAVLPATDEQARRRRRLALVFRRFARYPVTSLALLAIALGGVAALATGRSAASIAGGRAEVLGGADLFAVAKSFVLHLAALDLYVGILPFAAFLIVCQVALSRGASRRLRVFSVFGMTATVLLVAVSAQYLVAVYEGPYAGQGDYLRVYDRYVFYVAPIFLVAFLAWARDAVARRPGLVAAVVAAALVPLSFIWGGEAWKQPNSLAFIPWDVLQQGAGTTAPVYVLLVPACIYLGYLFARSRNVDWMLFLVAANLLLVGMFGQAVAYGDSRSALRQGFGNVEPSWIDDAVGRNAEVVALWSGFERRGQAGWRTIWQNELMNGSVRRVYYLRDPLPFGLRGVQARTRDGALSTAAGPLRAEYVLTDLGTPVAGRRVAVDRAVGMVVYRVDGPVRLR
jgi:Dolichyl-phosphate-mannose-protein mannosyltransferase